MTRIAMLREQVDPEFLMTDVSVLMSESREGIERMCKIVQDPTDVSRVDVNNGNVHASSEFGVSLLACSRQLSAGIARHWDFPSDVADAVGRAGDPGDASLALALAQGHRIAKIRLLLDACVLCEDDALVSEGLDNFPRRCLAKLSNLED